MRNEAVELGYFATSDDSVRPGVVMIHDVWGLTDHTRDLARRLAREGFAVLALDLYRRLESVQIDDPGSWMRALSDPGVLRRPGPVHSGLRHRAVEGALRAGLAARGGRRLPRRRPRVHERHAPRCLPPRRCGRRMAEDGRVSPQAARVAISFHRGVSRVSGGMAGASRRLAVPTHPTRLR